MFNDPDDDPGFRWFFKATPLTLCIILLFAILNTPRATPNPKNELVFGCYTNGQASAISLDDQGMHIMQRGFPAIPFHVEWQKNGYSLSADASIRAQADAGRFVYSIHNPGTGTYLHYFHVIDGRQYGVIDEMELSSFTMLARDGSYLPYTRAPQIFCKPLTTKVR